MRRVSHRSRAPQLRNHAPHLFVLRCLSSGTCARMHSQALFGPARPRVLSAAVSLGTALLTCAVAAFGPAGGEQQPPSLARFGSAAPHLADGFHMAATVLPTIVAVALPASAPPEAAERES